MSEWIKVEWREATEDESEYFKYISTSKMPDDGQEILLTVKDNHDNLYVVYDTCGYDEGGFYTEAGYDWHDDVIAWMPTPKPYKAESEEV